VSSNQNNSNQEPNAVPANEQNELPANTSQPPLNNEHAGSSEIPPLILQTEQPPMEVHAHTHTARKKWTHYFWEFLMLFLAVFCGFLAEYQLEHKIEKDRAKELARSLYEELQQDSVNMSVRLKNRVRQEASLKWLMKYFKDSSLTNVSKSFSFPSLPFILLVNTIESAYSSSYNALAYSFSR